MNLSSRFQTANNAHTVTRALRREDSIGSDSSQDISSKHEALWFSTLPDKVRRQRFSREEQERLAHSYEETVHRASPRAEEIRESGTGTGTSRSRLINAVIDFPANTVRSEIDNPLAYAPTASSASTEQVGFHSSQPKCVTTSDGDVSRAPSSQRGPQTPKQRPRILSLTPISLPPPTLAPAPPLPSPGTLRHWTISARTPKPDATPMASTKSIEFTPDPAVHSGVHSRQERVTPRASLPDTVCSLALGQSSSPSSPLSEYALPVQLLSPSSNDSGADLASLDTARSSTPPADGARRPYHAVTQSASFDSGIGLPLQLNWEEKPGGTTRSSSGNGFSATAESTTLNHSDDWVPEHRVHDFDWIMIPGPEISDLGPLALESLTVCDDSSGARGAFAVQTPLGPKGLQRVWNSIRRC